MSTSRVQRGRQSESIIASYLRERGWAAAERTPASLPGRDIQGTGEVAIEVKSRRQLKLTEWLAQAAKRDGLPVLIVRPDGYGEARAGQWAFILTVDEGVELLRKAGYGSDGKDNGSTGNPGVQGEERELSVPLP